MSNTNPYYREIQQSDSQFAQQSPQNHPNPYHSAYDSRTDINYKKQYFSQSNYPSLHSQVPSAPSYVPPPQSYVPPPPPQRMNRPQHQNRNFFTQVMDNYKNKRRATDLTQMSMCKVCNQMTQSFIVKKNSFLVWIIAFVLLIATYVCFFLPFLFDGLKNKHVVCKMCGKQKFCVKVW